MFVFFILVVLVGQGVVSYRADKGIWVGRTSVEEFIGQKTNELLDRWDV